MNARALFHGLPTVPLALRLGYARLKNFVAGAAMASPESLMA
jgi:hypothetical protein